VRFKGRDLFGGVVVVDTKLEVIRTADNPVLPRNESTGTDRDISELECFDDGLKRVNFSYASVGGTQNSLPVTRMTKCRRDLLRNISTSSTSEILRRLSPWTYRCKG
jgi:hypothetical protein